ncbi:HAMP domain-containing protein [Halomonas sp. GXIMD04776]|uniref:HAMP domain-containing protein n=1 Tax=Halomonas sp. GXIMD04776 TaxID=3415605 RepID=UPI003CB53362
MSNQQGQRAIANVDRLNAGLLKPINRTRVNIANAQIAMQEFVDRMSRGESDEAKASLAEAQAILQRTEMLFTRYLETPKNSEQGRQFEQRIQAAYNELVNNGLLHQIEALERGNLTAYATLKPNIDAAGAEFRQVSRELMDYVEERISTFMNGYAEQTDTAEIIMLIVLVLAGTIVLLVRTGMIRMVIRPLQEAVQHFGRIAGGDLSHKVQDYGRNEIGQLFSAMRDMQDGLTKTVSTVRNSSGSIHIGSREIASGNTDLSSRTEEQAAALQETAASMEELTTTVKQNADNARQGSTLAKEASTTATRGGEVVRGG